MHLGSLRGRPRHGRRIRADIQEVRSCCSTPYIRRGHPQRHEQHNNRISQQCSRNIYVVGTVDHNIRSWRWCRSGDAHTSESSVVIPIIDTFHWG